jgi:regulator of protease activity HflC (stomatin/prohibitin superfamily)
MSPEAIRNCGAGQAADWYIVVIVVVVVVVVVHSKFVTIIPIMIIVIVKLQSLRLSLPFGC